MYAVIELIDGKATLVRGVTNSDRTIPRSLDTSELQDAMNSILNFVQAQENADVEKAYRAAEEAKAETKLVVKEKETIIKAKQELETKVMTLQEEIEMLMASYEEWKTGEVVSVSDVRRYNNKLYAVIQAHTTQDDWTPDTALSLWKIYNPKETLQGTELIPDFAQPTGAHDAYKIDDKVRFEGKVYESTIDDNVWSPIEHPSSWKLI